jgi:PilZ domain
MKAAGKGSEQRTGLRHSCCADLQVVYEGLGRHIEVRAPDISPQGMFINTPQAFPEGTMLKIRFRLGHSGRLIQARSEVRYCLPGVGVGVEFVNISDEMRTAITEETCGTGADW